MLYRTKNYQIYKDNNMAQIYEEVVVIKLSKLMKSSAQATPVVVTNEIVASLDQIVQELVGDDVVVEIEKA